MDYMEQKLEVNDSSVKLIKNTKGYQWEIKCMNKDLDEAIVKIEKADKTLREKYGNWQPL